MSYCQTVILDWGLGELGLGAHQGRPQASKSIDRDTYRLPHGSWTHDLAGYEKTPYQLDQPLFACTVQLWILALPLREIYQIEAMLFTLNLLNSHYTYPYTFILVCTFSQNFGGMIEKGGFTYMFIFWITIFTWKNGSDGIEY